MLSVIETADFLHKSIVAVKEVDVSLHLSDLISFKLIFSFLGGLLIFEDDKSGSSSPSVSPLDKEVIGGELLDVFEKLDHLFIGHPEWESSADETLLLVFWSNMVGEFDIWSVIRRASS